MVFFFTPRGCEPRAAGEPLSEDYMIYMGLDKHENEVGEPPQTVHVAPDSTVHPPARHMQYGGWLPASTAERCFTYRSGRTNAYCRSDHDNRYPAHCPAAQDLIKWGLPHDVWFHVDALSSAHVYLRLPRGAAWDAIPPETLEDCVTLVKANSIEVTAR